MAEYLVLTVISVDKPGLVESLSATVASHGGNWMESRMARLGGQFAGILKVSVEPGRVDALAKDLRELESSGLHVVVERSHRGEGGSAWRELELELVGNDRPGIIRDISQALAACGVNVDELESECESAPMSGGMLFKARASLRVPAEVSIDALREALEEIANDLMVDLSLDDVTQ